MKGIASVLCLSIALMSSSLLHGSALDPAEPSGVFHAGGAGGGFSPNLGQFPDAGILFAGPGAKFTEDGISILSPEDGRVTSYSFLGCTKVAPTGSDPAPWTNNYYLGSDPSRWRTGVPVYREVVYRGLWEGIDLSIRVEGGTIRCDLDGEEGASLSQARFHMDGFSLDDARAPPVRSDSDKLIALTYLGGTDSDSGYGMDIGPDGRITIAGRSSSTDFPTTSSAYSTDYRGGFSDAVVSRFNRLCQLQWSTYVGGYDRDIGYDVAVGSDGSAYVTGFTDSYDFPTTVGAFDRIYNTTTDAFALKLSPDGKALQYSTYIGGTGEDLSFRICEDGGKAYVTGQTWSEDFPLTPNAMKSVPVGKDCFITRISAAGDRVEYSTLFGGSGEEAAYGIEVDGSGGIVVMGETRSADLPAGDGDIDREFGGVIDAFVCRIGPSYALDYCTYIGGERTDYGNGLALDPTGGAYVTGTTESVSFPVTQGAYQVEKDDYRDVYVTRIDPSGERLVYSTFIGDDYDDWGVGIDVDAEGHAYVTGFTNSPFFPTTKYSYDKSFSEGLCDAIVIELSADGSRLVYSSFLGGKGQDYGFDIRLQGPQRVYVVGDTSSGDLSTTSGAESEVYAGGEYDLYLAGMNVSTMPFAPRDLKATPSMGEVSLVWDPPSEDGGPEITSYRIYRSTSKTWGSFLAGTAGTEYVDKGLDNGRTYYYHISAVNFVGEGPRSAQVGAMPATVPDPVRNLTAVTDDHLVRLSWRPPADDGGYAVSRYSVERGVGGGPAMLLTNLTGPYLEDRDVTNGVRYSYNVCAVNWLGAGPWTTIEAVPATLPSVPLGLTLVEGDSNITLSWKAPSRDGGYPIDGYRVYRSEGEGPFIMIANDTEGTNYTDSAVTNGMTYVYHVSAFNKLGEGGKAGSTEVSPSSVPGQVNGFAVDSGSNWAQLTWRTADNGGSPLTGYSIYRGTSADSMELLTRTGTPDHKDRGLQKGRTYYYAVSATNRMGEGALSEVLATTPSTVPATPVNLQATAGKDQVTLTWIPPETGGSPITGYRIYRGTIRGEMTYLATTPGLSFVDRDVRPGSTYRYQVQAVNVRGQGPMTDDVSARIPDEVYENKGQSDMPLATFFIVGGVLFAVMILMTIVVVIIVKIRNDANRRKRWK